MELLRYCGVVVKSWSEKHSETVLFTLWGSVRRWFLLNRSQLRKARLHFDVRRVNLLQTDRSAGQRAARAAEVKSSVTLALCCGVMMWLYILTWRDGPARPERNEGINVTLWWKYRCLLLQEPWDFDVFNMNLFWTTVEFLLFLSKSSLNSGVSDCLTRLVLFGT